MNETPVVEEVVEDPAVDAGELVEEELDDEPYHELVILEVCAADDELWLN